MSLSALLTEYAESDPKRAAGGLHALSGFDYQLRVYLADFAAALVDSTSLEAAGYRFANALEALSDYTRLDQEHLVCVQAKFTLSMETLGKSALEFTLIDRFLEAKGHPELGASIRYEVVGRASALGQPLEWAHVRLPAKAETGDVSLKHRFERLRDRGALLPPRLEHDPWWRLICTVYPHISDPFGFARRALDRCLNRGRRPADASAVRDAIAEDFLLCRREQRLPGFALKATDFTPAETTSREIMIGQSPTLKHLRDGRFMARAERVSEALLALRRVVETHTATEDEGVDIFWISGRSGCGKSVLLLQLAEALVVERAARIVWLGNSAAQLPELLRYWSEAADQYDVDYVFIDDLYDPQARDDLDLSVMVSHILHTDIVRWPVIVTCGPPEFRSVFERNSRAEGFRVHTWELSPLCAAETQQFRVWFERRTGTVPHRGPASAQQEALMISVMAEMQHGDLRPFALRFRARLVDSKLDQTLRVPLALNRLYIWTPRLWLTSDEETRLSAFNLKGDISLLSVESRAREYLKLTHPHLSEAIYNTLRTNFDARGRAEDLVIAFQQALDSDLPTAFRLLRSVATDHARLHDVDPVVLATGMATVWTERLVSNLALYGSEGAEAWVYWSRWAARDTRVGDLLGNEALLDKAISSLGIAHRFWARLWLLLWQCAPGHPELVKMALNWLAQNREQHSWSYVWDTLAEHKFQTNEFATRSSLEDETGTRVLAEMGLRWLAENDDSLGWPWVWQRLAHIQQQLPEILLRDELVDSGTNWLAKHEKWSSWSYIWQHLLSLHSDSLAGQARRSLLEIGWNWLHENENNSGWAFVWQKLLNTTEPNFYVSKAELRQLGEHWSERHANSPVSAFISLALLESELISDAEDFGYVNDDLIAWCENNRATPRWQWLWHRLFSNLGSWLSSEQRARLIACAHKWLEDNEDHDRFGFVWEKVFREEIRLGHTSAVSRLLEKGLWFIADIADDTGRDWFATWFTLRNYLTSDSANLPAAYAQRLIDPALRWLKTPHRNNVEQWRQIYKPVIYLGRRDPELLKLGIENLVQGTYLAKHANSVGFAAFLCEWFSAQDLPENLVEWICQWLVAQAEDRRGISSWQRFHRATETALTQGPFAGWSRLRRTLDEFPPVGIQHWDRLIAAFHAREPVRGRIVKHVRSGMHKSKGWGFIVDVGINAYLPYDQFDYRKIRSPETIIGNTYEFEITRVDIEKFQIDLSRRPLLEQELKTKLAALTPGAPVRGTVSAIRGYGAFVDLGFSDALLYAGETATGKVTDLSLGQEISAKVLRIDLAKLRIWLTTKEAHVK